MFTRLVDPSYYAFNPHTVPTLAAAAAMFGLAVAVLIRERASRVSLLFAVSCLTIITWLFAFSWMYAATDPAVALSWARLAYLGVPLIPVSTYHFTLAVLQHPAPAPWVLPAVWSMGLIFVLTILTSNALIRDLYRYWWGFYPRYGWLAVPYLTYFFGLMALILATYWREWRTAETPLHRRRAYAFMTAFAIVYLGSTDYLAKFGVPLYPFGFFPVLIFLAMAARAIWQYRLVDMTLSLAAAPILERMSEAVLVLDQTGIVRLANRAALELLARYGSEVIGRPVTSLIQHPRMVEAVADAAAGRSPGPMEVTFLGAGTRVHRLTVTISPIHEASSSGLVCFLHDMTALRQAEEAVAGPVAEATRAEALAERPVLERAEQAWWRRSRWLMAVLLTLALALPVAALTWMEVRQVRRSLMEAAIQQHTATARLVAEALEQHITGLGQYIESFGTRPSLVAALEADDRAALRIHLQQLIDEHSEFDRAVLVESGGRVVADYPPQPALAGADLTYRDWYRGAVSGGRPYVSEVYLRIAEPALPLVGIVSPVRDAQGRIIGVLLGHHPLHRLLAWSVRSSALGAGRVQLFDRRGVLVTAPDEGGFEQFETHEAVSAALRGRWGTIEGLDPITDEPSILSYRPVKSIGWAVLVHQPMTAVLAAWHTTRHTLVVLSAICIVILVGLGLLWFFLMQRHGRELLALHEMKSHYVAELQQMLLDRRRAEQALLVLNGTLERRARELAQSQDALSRQSQILQSVLDSLADGVVVTDALGTCLLANPAAERILGQVPAEAPTWTERLGCYLTDAVTPCPVDELPVVRAMRGEAVDEAELFVRNEQRPDGVWVSINARPLRAHDGQVQGGVMVFRDITERKRGDEALRRVNAKLEHNQQELLETLAKLRQSHQDLEAAQMQLIQAEKMESVGRLAAGVAHEVKNPLAITLLGLEFLSHHVRNGDAQVDQVLTDMQEAIQRADSVIRGLLDFSHAKSLTAESASLNATIDRALLLVKPLLTRGHIQFTSEFAQDMPEIPLDGTKMEQVFVNIFMNAIQAMPEGGTLRLRTYSKRLTVPGNRVGSRTTDAFRIGDRVAVAEVEDTGHGIPDAYLRRVFDPFFTTKTVGKGTGLGLTVTKTIVELHRGLIEIVNRPEGGVRVTIMLPQSRAPSRTDPAGEVSPVRQGPEEPHTDNGHGAPVEAKGGEVNGQAADLNRR